MLTSIPKAASKEKIVAAFQKFDKNGDGVIDWEEFQQVRIPGQTGLYLTNVEGISHGRPGPTEKNIRPVRYCKT